MHSGPLDSALATIARDSEIGGPILAGAVAYRLFVFGLPVGFFLVSGLGVLARVLGHQRRRSTSGVWRKQRGPGAHTSMRECRLLIRSAVTWPRSRAPTTRSMARAFVAAFALR